MDFSSPIGRKELLEWVSRYTSQKASSYDDLHNGVIILNAFQLLWPRLYQHMSPKVYSKPSTKKEINKNWSVIRELMQEIHLPMSMFKKDAIQSGDYDSCYNFLVMLYFLESLSRSQAFSVDFDRPVEVSLARFLQSPASIDCLARGGTHEFTQELQHRVLKHEIEKIERNLDEREERERGSSVSRVPRGPSAAASAATTGSQNVGGLLPSTSVASNLPQEPSDEMTQSHLEEDPADGGRSPALVLDGKGHGTKKTSEDESEHEDDERQLKVNAQKRREEDRLLLGGIFKNGAGFNQALQQQAAQTPSTSTPPPHPSQLSDARSSQGAPSTPQTGDDIRDGKPHDSKGVSTPTGHADNGASSHTSTHLISRLRLRIGSLTKLVSSLQLELSHERSSKKQTALTQHKMRESVVELVKLEEEMKRTAQREELRAEYEKKERGLIESVDKLERDLISLVDENKEDVSRGYEAGLREEVLRLRQVILTQSHDLEQLKRRFDDEKAERIKAEKDRNEALRSLENMHKQRVRETCEIVKGTEGLDDEVVRAVLFEEQREE
ncbi:hypothetical protein ADUPG1_012858, partial [Aduncisulcus paluster]